MKFTLSWLKKHLDTEATAEQLADTLNTIIGLEVEGIEDKAKDLKDFVIAKVISCEPHPDSDHLNVLSVDNGSGENLQVVCGAPNVKANMWGVFAGDGVYVPGIDFTLSKVEIRGVESNGMMCSEKELGLSDEHEGIIELKGDNFVAGESFVKRFNLDDPVIDVELTPNRGDCCGVRGLAREFAAAGLGNLKPMEIKTIEGSFDSPIKVLLEDEKDCPLFVSRYIKNVDNTKANLDMKRDLQSIGAKSISPLVDITNYSTFDMARPLHVFDADKIKGNLVVRRAKDGEKMLGLDDIEYELDSSMIVIADENGVQSISGVMGARTTACDENTKNVLVECALFDYVSIAYTGRKTGIQSDARYRFERKLDEKFAATDAIEYATKMVLDLCGGEPAKVLKAGNYTYSERTMDYDVSRCLALGGVDISKEEQIKILESLEFGISYINNPPLAGGSTSDVVAVGEGLDKDNLSKEDIKTPHQNSDAILTPPQGGSDSSRLLLTIPSWRNDIGEISNNLGGQADIVEEVLRIYGYANIKSVAIPKQDGVSSAKVTDKKAKEIMARRVLAALGLSEAVTFTFTDEKLANLFGGIDDKNRVINPVSSEHGALRPSGLINLLSAVSRNMSRGQTSVNLFEIGPVYRKENKEETVEVSGLMAGLNNDKHWLAQSREVDVFDIKEILEDMMEKIGAPSGQMSNGALDYYHPGRSGTIALGKNKIAYFGEIHPKVLEAFGIKTRVVAFELLLNNIPAGKKKGSAKSMLEMSKFQAVNRDFAFVLDKDISAAKVVQTIKKADKLITDVDIFDVYEGANLGENKKSLAIKVRIEPKDETLTDKQLEFISTNVILNVSKNLGGELRK